MRNLGRLGDTLFSKLDGDLDPIQILFRGQGIDSSYGRISVVRFTDSSLGGHEVIGGRSLFSDIGPSLEDPNLIPLSIVIPDSNTVMFASGLGQLQTHKQQPNGLFSQVPYTIPNLNPDNYLGLLGAYAFSQNFIPVVLPSGTSTIGGIESESTTPGSSTINFFGLTAQGIPDLANKSANQALTVGSTAFGTTNFDPQCRVFAPMVGPDNKLCVFARNYAAATPSGAERNRFTCGLRFFEVNPDLTSTIKGAYTGSPVSGAYMFDLANNGINMIQDVRISPNGNWAAVLGYRVTSGSIIGSLRLIILDLQGATPVVHQALDFGSASARRCGTLNTNGPWHSNNIVRLNWSADSQEVFVRYAVPSNISGIAATNSVIESYKLKSGIFEHIPPEDFGIFLNADIPHNAFSHAFQHRENPNVMFLPIRKGSSAPDVRTLVLHRIARGVGDAWVRLSPIEIPNVFLDTNIPFSNPITNPLGSAPGVGLPRQHFVW